MPIWSVTISGKETEWAANVEAPNKRQAKVEALKLMQEGGGRRRRNAAATGELVVTVEKAAVPMAWKAKR